MPSYTLYYFDHRGRAEICRMIFAVAGVQYNDKRIDCKQWNSCRNKMPCSMLPVLEIDGKTLIPQSMAIARFLAREYGFYGKSNLSMVQNDSICDSLYELLDDYLRMYHDKDGRIMFDSRSDMRKKYIDMDGKMGFDMRSDMDCNSSPRSTKTTMGSPPNMSPGSTSPTISELDNRMTESRRRYLITCRRVLPFLEKSLEKQNGGIQFFLGDQLMMCDLMCFSALECPLMENPNLLNNFPKITALRNRVYNHAKLSGYLKTRSNCDW